MRHYLKPAAFLAAAMLVAATSLAPAHAPKLGVNGGVQVDASHLHVEAVVNGTALKVFLRDHGNQAVPTTGYKGTAILIVDGKAQRIPLAPAGDNTLDGTAAVSLPAALNGVIQITAPAGGTVQAKFQ